MAALGSVVYDPASAATVSGAALLAMTAFDTTNARITFNAPSAPTPGQSTSAVLVRMRVAEKGAISTPQTLLGVLDGSTIRGRQAPLISSASGFANATSIAMHEAVFLVTGLTLGQAYTWDAAYDVEFAVAATNFGWGGPNNGTSDDAYGGFVYDIWPTPGLLAGTLYDPSTAASIGTATAAALAALDTTNLRLTFTTPSSGRVLVVMRAMGNGTAGTLPGIHFAVLEGATVRGRAAAMTYYCNGGAKLTTDHFVAQSEVVIGGLGSGNVLTWDAAMGVEHGAAATQLRWGGPNNTTQDDAYGGFAYEIWAA